MYYYILHHCEFIDCRFCYVLCTGLWALHKGTNVKWASWGDNEEMTWRTFNTGKSDTWKSLGGLPYVKKNKKLSLVLNLFVSLFIQSMISRYFFVHFIHFIRTVCVILESIWDIYFKTCCVLYSRASLFIVFNYLIYMKFI